MMRVVMLIWSFWPAQEGGAEKQCRKVVEWMAGKEADFIIITSRFKKDKHFQEEMAGGKVVRLGFMAPLEAIVKHRITLLLSYLLTPLNMYGWSEKRTRALQFWVTLPLVWFSRLTFVIGLRRWFSNHADTVDVIHVHETGWLAGVAGWLGNKHNLPVLAKTATTPAFPMIGYDTPLRNQWYRYRKKCFFIAQHDGLIQELVAEGIAQERLFLLTNGIDIPRNAAAPYNRGPVLYVGNFTQGTHWKAFDILIKAWSIVHQQIPDIKIHMVGGGDVTRWKRFANDLECCNSIRFVGPLQDLSKQYENAMLFVLPSRVEGISNALLEAQSYGLPCIASDILGNSAVVKHNVNGLLVPVGDEKSLAQAIIRLVEEPDLRRKLGLAARGKMIEEFNLERVTDSLLAIYKTVTLKT